MFSRNPTNKALNTTAATTNTCVSAVAVCGCSTRPPPQEIGPHPLREWRRACLRCGGFTPREDRQCFFAQESPPLRVRPEGASFCIFQDPIMSHKCMSKTAVKTSKDTHKSAAELGTP